ncbi:thioredoxin domain-containing protein [Nesterenkonia natronophila]|uniref:Thioredoxin n=1 Tax=Nesterenkonia natronophila TaxID=2174932 RepID=A0A3A4F8J7_9MICC|nr:thioredoxin domain-containing protein [Nesterenkonia natronophila]RJN31537.1 thioredoxin [Nesterenkonia natronophila]
MARNGVSAREQARKLQQEQERKQKMQSLLLRIGVVVVAVAVVLGLTLWVVNRGDNGNYTEGPAPTAANEQGGFVLTSSSELAEGDDIGTVDAENIEDVPAAESPEDMPVGVEPREEGEPPHVVIYTDAACPGCGSFEAAYHQMLTDWVDAGAITLEYRSVQFQPTAYSARAANAFACMAEEHPEHFSPFLGSVTAESAQGADYSNEELSARAEDDYGVDISDCVEDGDYRAFVSYTTGLASANGVTATPSIYVDGEQVEDIMATGEVILAAVEDYQSETGEELADEVEEDVEDVEDEDIEEGDDAENE